MSSEKLVKGHATMSHRSNRLFSLQKTRFGRLESRIRVLLHRLFVFSSGKNLTYHK
jgi:hypothetical protein